MGFRTIKAPIKEDGMGSKLIVTRRPCLSNFYPGKLLVAGGDDWSSNYCYQCGDWLAEGAKSGWMTTLLSPLRSPSSSSSDIKLVLSC